jgi:hypothetical protein
LTAIAACTASAISAAAGGIEALCFDRLADGVDAAGEQVQLFELVLVLHHVRNGDQAAALHSAVGGLGAREVGPEIEMRIILVEDLLTALGNPEHAPIGLAPDLPEFCALAVVGAADLLGIAVDAVLGLLVGVAGVLL